MYQAVLVILNLVAAAWCVPAIACTVRGLPTGGIVPHWDQPLELGCNWQYGDKGFQWVSPCDDTSLWIGLRFQTRYDSYSGDLATVEDLIRGGGKTFDLRRGRLKGGGPLFWKWFEVYSEYDWRSDTLLDYRATATLGESNSIRVGQWKSDYNRERVDSSGKQQLVERSLSNFWFTVDRQQGIATSTRFLEESRLDNRIWLGFLSGQGRGGGFKQGRGLGLVRWQWNPAGIELPFSQSDLKRRKAPVPSVAFATVFGRTPFTRFSGSGGGDLPGFAIGDYNLNQFLFETALHYRGIGWQQELHWKNIENRETGEVTRLIGGYAQIGSFLNEWFRSAPPRLELVGRISLVDPNGAIEGNTEREWTIGANWFINGHRNKLTGDISWLDFDSPVRDASQTRYRLQWELSI